MKRVSPGRVSGQVAAPPSKSHAQRVIACACLAQGSSRVFAPGDCADVRACLGVAASLGAAVTAEGADVIVTGRAPMSGGDLDCGEGGLCLRMFAAIAALGHRTHRLLASGSLMGRPVGMAVEPLEHLGVRCHSRGDRPPLEITGPLRGGDVVVDGRVSSQFLSGLLMALPVCDADSRVRVTGLVSRPYVEMTLRVMTGFGVRVDPDRTMENFTVAGGQQYSPMDVVVEGDWSAAAFILVAGAVAGTLTVTGLDENSAQADVAVLVALGAAGADVRVAPGLVKVGPGELRGFAFDATECPDLFPPLAALALHCAGETRLKGAGRLAVKESDRGRALVEELGAIGGNLTIVGDELVIHGGRIRGGRVDARGDHRIAMAGAVAALCADGHVDIGGAGCVEKSYPGFFDDLKRIGASVS